MKNHFTRFIEDFVDNLKMIDECMYGKIPDASYVIEKLSDTDDEITDDQYNELIIKLNPIKFEYNTRGIEIEYKNNIALISYSIFSLSTLYRILLYMGYPSMVLKLYINIEYNCIIINGSINLKPDLEQLIENAIVNQWCTPSMLETILSYDWRNMTKKIIRQKRENVFHIIDQPNNPISNKHTEILLKKIDDSFNTFELFSNTWILYTMDLSRVQNMEELIPILIRYSKEDKGEIQL